MAMVKAADGTSVCVLCHQTLAHHAAAPFMELVVKDFTLKKGFATGFVKPCWKAIMKARRMNHYSSTSAKDILESAPHVRILYTVQTGDGTVVDGTLRSVFVITGESGCGKTTLACDMLSSMFTETSTPLVRSKPVLGFYFSGFQNFQQRTLGDTEQPTQPMRPYSLEMISLRMQQANADIVADRGNREDIASDLVWELIEDVLMQLSQATRAEHNDVSSDDFRAVIVFDEMGECNELAKGLVNAYYGINKRLEKLRIGDVKIVIIGTNVKVFSVPGGSLPSSTFGVVVVPPFDRQALLSAFTSTLSLSERQKNLSFVEPFTAVAVFTVRNDDDVQRATGELFYELAVEHVRSLR